MYSAVSDRKSRLYSRIGIVSFMLLVICGVSTCTTSGVRPELEPFVRTENYDYHLSQLADARSVAIEFTAEGFVWPAVDRDADTAMLELNLERSEGKEPEIQVRVGELTIAQYFERGGRGRRYLDLSPLLASTIRQGDHISLQGRGVIWSKVPAQLITFANPPISGRRVLVVAPHPDDAEIAAFGLYKTADADVVTVTAGDAGGGNFMALWPDEGAHYRTKGWIRTMDSLMVPFFGGLQPDAVRNLGYYDATLRNLWRNKPGPVEPPMAILDNPGFYRQFNFDTELRNRRFEATWPALVSDFLAELERVQPQSIVVPHPLLDRHLDHQFTAIAVFEALAQWDGECEVLLYTNHAVGNEAFPLGPRAGMTGLPAWNGNNLHIRRLYSHLLSSEDQKQKLIALEAMHDLRPFDLRDEGLVQEISSIYDYFRRAARPNEIFLVTDMQGAQQIRNDFLDTVRRLQELELLQ